MNPEKDDGNIEYKLKLIDKTKERVDELSTQMRYRVDEGCGEAIYVIGVTDTYFDTCSYPWWTEEHSYHFPTTCE